MTKKNGTEKLTKMQERVLRKLIAYRARQGCSPTERELAVMVRRTQTAVRFHLASLIAMGYVRRVGDGGMSSTRSLVVLCEPPAA